MTGSARIIRADSRALPLADESVDLVVTSPPYFGLRSYQDGGAHYQGQIGDEATPAEFIAALLDVTRECMRVLKPSGSMFVNLGDKYATRWANPVSGRRDRAAVAGEGGARPLAAPEKSLILIPERYRIACVDELGLIARAVIVWSKCLSGGARVYARTSTGDRPLMLRDLYRAYRPEDVQLWNGQQWTQVVGWERTARDEPLEIEFRTGERVGCTRDHRWPTRRGVVRADELMVGDVVESTRLPQPDAPRTPALLPDEDIGWLVGLYIAEGSRSETTIQFAGHVREDLRHARLARIAAALDGTSAVYQTSDNGATCNLHGSVIAGVIDRYVSTGTARTKRLRHAAWQRSDAFLAAVVEGYLSGDGHYDAKNDRWRVGFTENDEWAADLRTLAARLGAVVRLRRYPHQGFGKTFPGWRGEWRWTRSAHGNARPDGEIVAIRASRARDFYDVEVADDPHLFALASGLLTHNSNGLPESVTDRVRRSHEDWVHLTKMPRYYSAVDEIREPVSGRIASWNGARGSCPKCGRPVPAGNGQPVELLMVTASSGSTDEPNSHTGSPMNSTSEPSPTGSSSTTHAESDTASTPAISNRSATELTSSEAPGPSPHSMPPRPNVETVTSSPTPARTEPRTAPGCVACVCGHEIELGTTASRGSALGKLSGSVWTIPTQPLKVPAHLGIDHFAAFPMEWPRRIIRGWSPEGGTVLDPFGGTGTTALVARAWGRHGISVDMSADYCRLAEWRTNDPGELARAMQVDKPPQQLDGQLGMFEESA